ncbi:EAL domain-containing protein [Pseudokineococcus sp. 1T1Z-3]|uniref:EAL domain-containing protein n=1 Tax=Pseudokineococcus sp. 1T1Z-3 TaxID=3132745 RepID=UPI0030B767BB
MGGGGRRVAGTAVAVGLLLVVILLLVPRAAADWVVLAALAPGGPLVALAVRRHRPERRAQWLLVAAAGLALALARLGTLLGSEVLVTSALVAFYVCLGTSAHLALGPGRGRRLVLAVDIAAVAVVGLAAGVWVAGTMAVPPPSWAVVLTAGDLVLLAYLVALLHARARVTPSVVTLMAALAALTVHHTSVWLAAPESLGGQVALVLVSPLAVAAAWHPTMAAFGDVASPLVALRRQALVVLPAVLALPSAGALAAFGVLPWPPPDALPVVTVGTLLAVALMTASFSISAAVDRTALETDPVTRTGSRLALERVLSAQIHSGTAPVHLVVVELDEVSALATRQGRQAADDLLRARAAALVQRMPDAAVCRTGPQTLAVVAPEDPEVGEQERPLQLVAAVRSELLRQAQDSRGGGGHLLPAAVLTVRPRAQGMDRALATHEIVELLLRLAELSLLEARDRGVPVEADVTREGEYERARRLDSDLAAALADGDQIAVHYQPQVEPRSGAVRSVEALVRWDHPELGSVAPDDFLTAASLQRLSRDLDDVARRQALADFARWRAAGLHLEHVAVNLSAASLESPDLVERVVEDLAESGLAPTCLVLEVVEQEPLRDLRAVARRLSRLAGLGVGVAVDDFGVGHAALQYLLHLPVTAVKLDRSLVAEVTTPDGRALLGSAVALASSLGATAIAEGVESAEQMRAVGEIGFALAQGFYCGRPRPAAETALLLATTPRAPAAVTPAAVAPSAVAPSAVAPVLPAGPGLPSGRA